MVTSTNRYAGSIPNVYHKFLVPLIFDPYAAEMAAAVAARPAARILELAAGTGVLSVYLAEQLPPSADITVTDLNPAMLEVAERNLGDRPNVNFCAADGTDLPFDNASFDIVVCQFGFMFFPDAEAGYREAARVLRPGGRLVFNVWDRLGKNHFSRAVHEAALALDSDDPPRFLAKPYAYHDTAMITAQLADAGFDSSSADVLDKISTAPSARHVALALAAGSPLATQLAERGLTDVAVNRIEAELLNEFGAGTVCAPMRAIQFEARLPATM